MSSLVNHAKAELRRAGMFDADADYGGEIAPAVVALMETFTAYGHSGGSAALTLEAFTQLANGRALTPLTGEDDEWIDRSVESGYPMWQNNRNGNVFKDLNGAYRIVGSTRVDLSFPCHP